MKNPAPGVGRFLGVNFWNIDWQGQDQYFRAGVTFANVIDPWRSDLVPELSPYKVLRFMDWNDTNSAQTMQAHFATRKQKTAAQNQPVAYEWQIDLCNRARTDCWLNLHHLSNVDDWRQLAQLFRNNLDRDLRLYVEWSNETWNTIFPQATYAANQATALALPGSNKAAAYTVHASVRAFEEFSRAFAGDEQRLVRVLSGFSAWSGPCDAQVAALNDRQINPNGIRPDVYAIAPYLYGKTVTELRNDIPNSALGPSRHQSCAQAIGVPVIGYEGGQDSYSAGVTGCQAVQTNPAMRGIYRDFLTAQFDAGMKGPFMQYTHSGPCWGTRVRTGDAVEASPKLQGLLDWLLLQPG
jgi:hypothetical protein